MGTVQHWLNKPIIALGEDCYPTSMVLVEVSRPRKEGHTHRDPLSRVLFLRPSAKWNRGIRGKAIDDRTDCYEHDARNAVRSMRLLHYHRHWSINARTRGWNAKSTVHIRIRFCLPNAIVPAFL